MGLDVVAFSNAWPIESEDPDLGYHVYSVNGIDRMDGKPEGRYCGENEFSFRAGSYGGYNEFRSWLSKTFIGAEPKIVWESSVLYCDKPFYELVNFGDNEGAFGPATSAKLAADFAAHAAPICEEYYARTYGLFKKAFEIASDDGFVVFC